MKDAIKYFKKRIDVDSKICNLRTCDAEVKEIKMRHISYMQMAIEALEKQIPKKPIIKTNLMTKHVSVHCSICDTDITYYSSGENYCHNCGQAIKWA